MRSLIETREGDETFQGSPLTVEPSSTDVHNLHNHVHPSYTHRREEAMATAPKRIHKHFQLDSAKIKRAQKALRARTETEAIERALDLAIAEHEKNRLALAATERFLKSGIQIRDVYNTLGS